MKVDSKSVDNRLRVQIPRLFVYGILKRGKSLDLTKYGCRFLGEAELPAANLYHIGSGVGLKLNEKGTAYGEVFEIPEHLWHWLDEIEGNGFVYTRKTVEVAIPIVCCEECSEVVKHEKVDAWVYEHNHHFREQDKILDGVYRGDY